ncbi:MAG: type II toxin-antitoxin system RelB/DinJ family antitoxin [Bacilli bacterium]|nr:type II toxin-antitoxin system RelB/DinJ family antitoxin [Bacilli bacterium]
MMNNISSVSFRIDTDLKNKADALFAELGLNMTTAFNIFLRQTVREGKIPFAVSLNVENKETVEAMVEELRLENDPNVKTYSLEEALKELKQ